MIRFGLLGSGSNGNALLVRHGSTKVLVDNGLSFKMLQHRAAEAGETLDDLAGVFVTHEHSDHVGGIGVLARKTGVPVYMTRGTYQSLPSTVGAIPKLELFEAGDVIPVNGLSMASYSVSHDAADPVSYVAEAAGVKLGVATDLGHAPQMVRARLMGAHGLVLESNYCPNMLRQGKYPPMVQQRIRGRQGHLSNSDMCELLEALRHDRLQVVVLVHISEENNAGDLAMQMAVKVMRGFRTAVQLAYRDRPTPMFDLAP